MLANLRARWVDGALEFFTRGTDKTALKLTGDGIKAALIGAYTATKAGNYALADGEKSNVAFVFTLSVASKTVTLGFPAGQIAVVYNAGATNAFTLKNIAADTGTSIAAGKAVLVIAGATADATHVIAIN